MKVNKADLAQLWTEQLHVRFSRFAANAQSQLTVVSPFITRSALEYVLNTVAIRDVTVITTWKMSDVLRGTSDLHVYPYLRFRGWKLHLCEHLHAKLLVADWQSAIISTANITQRGLGLVASGNRECAHLIDRLSTRDQRWVFSLISDSVPVSEEFYTNYRRYLSSSPGDDRVIGELVQGSSAGGERSLDRIVLPLTLSPRRLLTNFDAIRRGGASALGCDALQATLHDVSLFTLAWRGSTEENACALRKGFLALPIVKEFRDFIDPGRYFGEVKNWLRHYCIGGSPWSGRHLTSCVQVLFSWLVELGVGSYEVERPHYSQFIVPVQTNVAITSVLGEDVYKTGGFDAPPYRCTGFETTFAKAPELTTTPDVRTGTHLE
jgi:hypothetical protein